MFKLVLSKAYFETLGKLIPLSTFLFLSLEIIIFIDFLVRYTPLLSQLRDRAICDKWVHTQAGKRKTQDLWLGYICDDE